MMIIHVLHELANKIIDRRTSLPVHQIKKYDPRHSSNGGLKWHDNHIMISHRIEGRGTVRLYDIRKGDSSTATASTLSSSMIWCNNRMSVSLVDFSNDFQIAHLHCTNATSVVDTTSSSLTPLYTLPITSSFGAQTTHNKRQIFDLVSKYQSAASSAQYLHSIPLIWVEPYRLGRHELLFYIFP
jgi:hypothetical protein